MDGVTGLTQPAIPSGKTTVYSSLARRQAHCTTHYGDEMVQMAAGHDGLLGHTRKPGTRLIDEGCNGTFASCSVHMTLNRTPQRLDGLEPPADMQNSRVFPASTL